MSRLTVVRSVSANRGTKWSTGKRLSLAVGLALVLLVMLAVTPVLAQSTLVQIFYVPITEAQALASMETVHSDATDPVWSYVSIAIGTTGTRINYDQWENGYEANLDSPTDLYSTVNTDGTQIWGNGNCADGFPPNKDGSTTITLANCNANPATVDALASGNVVVLRNSVPAASPAIIDFDGRDKFGATEQIAVSRLYWSSGNCSTTGAGTCLGGAIEVYPTSEWASSYVSPVGVNQTFSDMFTYSAFAVQAFHPGTAVTVDVNGSTAGGATNYTLNEGDSIVVANIQQGATVTSTFPVQVHLLTGDPDSSPYEYSIYTLVPRQQWGASYYSPVGTNSPSFSGSVTQITLYNPGPGTLDVRCDFRTSSTNINNIAVNATQSVAVPNGSGAHCYAVTADNGTVYDASRQFFAIGTVDSAYLQSNSNSGGVWDWGFTLLPNSFLTPQALVGLGIGQDPNSSSTENGSPVWVTPVCSAGTTSTYIYVDRNGDGTPDTVDLNGDNDAADTNVGGLNETTANNGLLVSVLQSVKLRDHTDQDQTGMKIWSKTAANNGGAVGCDLAVVWGEDPNVASQANPGFDVGTTVPPLSSYTVVKTAALATDADDNGFVTPGDTLTYTVEIKNTGLAPITSLRVTDTVPAFTSYVAGSTYKYTNTTWVQIPDEAGTTALANGEDLAPPDTLPIGSTFRLRFKVTINAMTACSENIINNVSVYALNKEKTAIAITPLDCPTTIELRKSLAPPTDPGRFNLSIAGPGGFSDVATNQGHLGTTGVNTVATGVYTVTETGGTTPVTNLADYSTGLVCVNNNAASPAVDFTAGGRVTLSEGQEVVCTFTNTRLLPDIGHDKVFVSATAVGDTWDVVYRIVVSNTGAASGVYTLTDQPAMDDDIDINSASFASTVPSGSGLAGDGPWSLATNQSLNAGVSHIYTLTVNVDMNLAGGGGDDSYDRCLPTPDGAPDQGLFNRVTLMQPGQPGRDADACGDIPNIVHDKEFVSATAAAGDTWDVVYRITVNNNGGASGTYSLSDQPSFDDDVTINSASFASTVPSGSGLAGDGPWSLATNQSLNAGASHIYTLTVNVDMDLAGGSGDDSYDRCLPTPDGAPDQGLFNRATLTQPGQPGRDADACGDIPNIVHDKEFVSATAAAGDTWDVVYRITVNNNGGASGTYSLSDQPSFDDDVTINSASFASTVPSGSGLAGDGPWSLATNQSLNAGASHIYTLTVNVDMDLAGGSGDDSYDRCLPTPDGAPDQGLFNRATLTQPGQPGRDADACGDIPNIVHDKEFVSATAAAGDTWDVVYRIVATNNGGASGHYTLTDQPAMDNDVTINSASFVSSVPSNGALAGNGPWTLATNQSLNAGASHVYTLTVNVGLNLTGGAGDDEYDRCLPTPDGAPDQGLFNRVTLTQPGQPGRDADACGDVPNIVHDKEFVSVTAANGGWDVVYRIVATNNGGASGVYTLSDQPAMDNDVTINSAGFVSSVPSNGALAGTGPWTLATNQSLNAGASHVYTLTVNVGLNLAGGGGNDVYDRCLPTPDGAPDQGLFNRATLTQPGQPGRDADACGDVPNIVHDKEFVSATAAAGDTWDVIYRITVNNNGGASGTYTLSDQPSFDDDIDINSAGFASSMPSGSGLAGDGPWSLATNQSLNAGASHIYTLTVNVGLNLAGGSGDDSYDRCLPTPDGAPDQGLFNRVTLTQPGQPGRDADACGDVPNIVHDKEFVSATAANGGWNVVYRIVATNNGGASGTYTLSDQPAMDNDVTINSASFVSTLDANTTLNSTPWSLATNRSLAAGASHIYTLTVNVDMDLAGGIGDDSYDRCLPTPDGAPDQGLFNRATLTQPGQPGRDADACGDLPNIVHDKEFVSATAAAGDTWDVIYRITVNNNGGTSGVYSLSDQPAMDDDIDINSASFASTVPSGSGLAGDGPWSLATNQSLNAGASHVYTLTVNVDMDLAGGIGDDSYDRCLPTPDGAPDQGLFNRVTLTQPGQPGRDADACGDLPNVTHNKDFVEATEQADGSWNFVYRIVVSNNGGVTGVYDLEDEPIFDDDLTINSASFVSTAPSGGPLAGDGPWTLGSDVGLAAGASHVYTLTVNATLDMAAGSPGDNTYTVCGAAIPGTPRAGEGGFNESRLDGNNDGVFEEIDQACGDIPFINHAKTFISATQQPDLTWSVLYRITVANVGGVTGQYSLQDQPGFDDDIAINSASFVSTLDPSTVLAATPWTLATNRGLAAGASHVYTLTANVTLDLAAGSGGDNVYTSCGATRIGDPQAGEGLFNVASLDRNADGVFDVDSDDCGNITTLTHSKQFISASPAANATWDVIYRIVVDNQGGASGVYTLTDQPAFDDDVAINSASFVSTLDASTALASTPWRLASNRSLAAGGRHVYTMTVNVTLDLTAGSGGNNVYTVCGAGVPGAPQANEGLFNRSGLDVNGDGLPDEVSEDCGDLPYIAHTKTFMVATQQADLSWDVNYRIVVANVGGVAGSYSLSDQPTFDDDVAINSASFVSTLDASTTLTDTPWALAASRDLDAGAFHVYTLTVNVDLDLADGAGNNIYDRCQTTANGKPGEGLFNNVTLTQPGQPDREADSCGDIPYIVHDKQFVGATAAGDAWEVVYAITVRNDGGALGQYDLTDQPSFDNDVTIESASYASSVPSDSPLAVTGPWQLGDNVALAAGASHRYTITVNVDLDLTPGSSGDNSYSACGVNTGTPQADEGLFNKSFLDVNDDGVVDQTAEDCGDLPNIVHDKAFISATAGAGDTWDVVYRITVNNNGGASGTYTLSDQPAMDDDVTINSASFVSTLDGSTTLNSTPWSLATNRSLAAGASHVYTLTVNVGLNLTGGSGDDEYDRCLPTPDGAPDQGLFNRATLTQPGQPGRDADACGDVPNIAHDKEFVSATPANGGWNVVYRIVATNSGGASGTYSLSDQPAMDNDVTINSAGFVSSVPSNGALAGSGPWTLATNQSLAAGASHIYTLTVNVGLNLAGGIGDDSYDRCLPTPDGAPDQGLFNRATLTQPGQPGRDADACGDVPNIVHDKEFVSATAAAGDTWDVVYRITVNNNGGASGVYTLSDQPAMDNDVTINSASFVSTVPSNGALAGSGPWTLATNQSLNAGASHVYTLTVNVDMNLAGGIGDDSYDRCLPTPDGAPDQGLFNRATLTQPGQPGRDADACGDVPNIVHDKEFVSATAAAGDTWDVVYRITVNNNGGASGVYTLSDQPAMDNDVIINSASFVSSVPSGSGLGATPWTLAANQSLNAGASHVYTLTVNVGLNLAGGGGNDVYDRCLPTPDGAPNQGLFNRATLTQPGQPGRDADACGDVPNIVHDKEFVSATAANGGWNVVYRIVATNNGGASGVYTLTDQPAMDNDVTINSASFVSTLDANTTLNSTPWSLATNRSLNAGASHIYTLTVNVGLNLAGGGGNDVYDRCLPTPDGAPNQGLFNRATLTQPGQPGRDADACGDVPNIVHDKEFVSATAAAGNTWNVVYRIVATNNGGASGVYTLTDQPAMDNDVTINSASFVSTLDANTTLNSTPWSLATNRSLAAGASHVYTLTVNVGLNLAGGGGNDVYDRCLPTPDGAPNQGLFNRATLTQPGQPGRDADACGDVPNIVHDKEFVSATAAAGNTWNVVYRIVATNNGGASGVYTLTDQPAMDNDVTINSASFVSTLDANTTLNSTPWSLATNRSLAAGASHVYTLTVNVGLNLAGGGGNDVYDRCLPTPDGAPNQGLFNRVTLTQPGQPGRDADACGDVPNIVHDKEFVSVTAANGGWDVVYRIVATNNGGASGVYTLSDQPAMDNDVTINSAGFVSSVPSNGALAGTGPWTLATNQSLNAGASHVYTLTVNVGLNLAGGGGNDVYDRCLPTPDGAPDQGLFNRATLTQPGQPGRDADACGDVPNIVHDKEFVSATAAAGDTWDVVYRIVATNNGGANGVYSLSDQPAMDNDVTINSASFVSSVPSNGALAGSGPWSLATNQSLNAGASHVYTLTVNVGLNLAGGGGNDVYDRCLPTPDGAPDQGLFNRATLTQPGQPGRDADACGDVPSIVHDKEFVSATAAAGDTWDVVYRITVNNNGGASGVYTLSDQPAFDDDIDINSASFASTVPSGSGLAGDGPWSLATNQSLNAGASRVYTLTVNVGLNLAGGGGNDVYDRCLPTPDGAPDQGLFNRATLTQPGQPGRDADACGDVPNIVHDKEFVSATAAGGDTWDVVYRITVNNTGGASGVYTLSDQPSFDDDIDINSAGFASTVPSGGPLAGDGPWSLATNQSLNAGASHVYTLTVNVDMDLAGGSGDDSYDRCLPTPDGAPDQGLFNRATLTQPGQPGRDADACGDVPSIVHDKEFVSATAAAGDTWDVVYRITVNNNGGASGVYTLSDQPAFDDDIDINSASFASTVPSGSGLAGDGPWSLATNQSLNAGASRVYTLTVNVGLNLAGGGGNDVYDRCLPTPDGAPDQGLFNRATLTQPGQPGRDADACGDVPNIVHDKEFVSATAAGGDTWDVVYRITVNNTGGASGVYTLSDQPSFDDDIDINSAGFASTVPSGGPLAGDGPWSLATNQSLNAGASHVYTLTVNVDMDLAGGSGDDSYDRCLPTPDGAPDQGLFNRATLTQPGQPGRDADACGDVPNIVHDKEFVSATAAAGDTWDVVYRIVATNNGGASGTYSLSDQPSFDDDVTINSASFASTVPSGSGLAGSGPWTLATNQSLNAGASHVYTLTVNVGLNLAGGGGNDVYDRCLPTPDGAPNQGLFNRATLTQPGQPGRDADACGDVPNIVHDKEFVSATAVNGGWNVVYRITVNNNGGTSGVYTLSDQPSFDDDIDINSAGFASTVPSGSGLTGDGPWSLATNQSLNAGASHIYTLTVNVDMDLAGGSGDDDYDRCQPTPDGAPNQGLFNRVTLTQPGQPGRTADACGDVPNIVHDKEYVSATAAAGDTWNVVYRITVNNNGGTSGVYSLADQPAMDNDVTINSAGFVSSVPSNGALTGSGPWALATNQSLNAGASHVYTLTVNVGLNLTGGSGNDVYDRCLPTPDGAPNQGLFNRATLTQPGQPGRTADACGDLPNITHNKALAGVTQQPNGSWNLVYRIDVLNNGGAAGQYDLIDRPAFDDDLTINSASFVATAPGLGGALAGTGPWTLANDQNLAAGAIHIYTVTVNATVDLTAGSSGNNVYTRCAAATPGNPQAGEGGFNESLLDRNNDGVPDQIREACGDVPYITHDKSFVAATRQPNGTWNVNYTITVFNSGGATGRYDLVDEPTFDNDLAINSASFVSTVPSGGPLVGAAPWTLANDVSLAAGAAHMYTLTVNVTLDLAAGSGGDNLYTFCAAATPGNPQAGEGVFNESRLDTNNDGTPDQIDEACGDIYYPDLALRKSVASFSETPLVPGLSKVTFRMEIINQGNVPATNVTVVDYVPAGFTFNAADNPGWTGGANPTTVVAGPIQPGDIATVDLVLRLNAGTRGATLANFAEIANDGWPAGSDIDSTPDMQNQETPVKDDVIDEDGKNVPGEDEDDHDAGIISVQVFDLALMKRVAFAPSPIVPGQSKVTFAIEVFNQGDITATNVLLTDYVQQGFTFSLADNPGWTAADPLKPTLLITGAIAPGRSAVVNVVLGTTAEGARQVVNNFAEISAADDVTVGNAPSIDVDSTPDSLNQESPVKDDVIDEDGKNVPGQDEDDHDIASLRLPGVGIGGFVWADLDNSGTFQPGETTFDGVTVQLYRAGDTPGVSTPVASQVTANGGNYLFTDLAPGRYFVYIPTPPAGHPLSSTATDTADNQQKYDDNGIQAIIGGALTSPVIDLQPGQEPLPEIDGTDINIDSTIDFGFLPPVSLGNLVWHDANDNGQRDNGEAGIDGVGVQLFRADQTPGVDAPIATTTTAGGGQYLFSNLTPGEYIVYIPTPPAAYPASSSVTDNADNGQDNDDNGAQATVGGPVTSPTITLTPGQEPTSEDGNANSDLTIDFGFYGPLSLGDIVWHDANNNGLRDNGETGIAGVNVQLFQAGQTPGVDNPVAVDVTDANGNYRFDELRPGQYFVYMPTPPADYPTSSTPTSTADDNVNDDDNGVQASTSAPVTSAVVTLTSGAEPNEDGMANLTIDFGFYRFDLALRKTVASLSSTPLAPGVSTITFTIAVFNQGDIPATNVTVVDYVPAGLVFEPALNPGWSGSPNPTTVIAGPIASGQSVTIQIVLRVAQGTVGQSIANGAEIAADNQPPGTDPDSRPDTQDQETPVKDDVIDEDAVANPGVDDEDDHDTATITVERFDLALRKRVGAQSDSPLAPGVSTVAFVIEVFNQGDVPASNVTVIDYVPVGLVFEPALNPGWSGSPNPTTVIAGPIQPGQSATVQIVLRAAAGTAGQSLSNGAEIANDNTAGADMDSTPDTQNQETPVKDDVIDENALANPGVDDEDDHDIATVAVGAFDLALRKRVAPGQPSILVAGNSVTSTIEVFNQGDITATNITIVDYIPAGFAISATAPVNAGWVVSGNVALTTLPGPLAPGASMTRDIVLLVVDAVGVVNNYAEIASANDTIGRPVADVDSTPDTINGNDPYVDDVIDDDGTTDEDDHDGAEITVDRFDMSLIKRLADGQEVQVQTGDDVAYTIQVRNEGSAVATEALVIDYIPSGFVLSPVDTNGWVLSADGRTATNTIAGPIPPGGTASIDIVLRVTAFEPATYINIAEILLVYDEEGNPHNDEDSTPNDDPGDDDIDGDGVPDEDDIDSAVVEIQKPTAITLSSFTANFTGGVIRVLWTTTLELDTMGFHLYRSTTSSVNDAVRITPALIPGQGSDGGAYSFDDTRVSYGVTYWYWLVETETTGTINFYGPVRATAIQGNDPQGRMGIFLPIISR